MGLAGRFIYVLGISLVGVVMAATQPAPAQLQVLDAMDDISAWKSLASDGASATVLTAQGVQGGALMLEYDLARTAGYAAATRALSVELPDDYEISFWLRGEAGRNHLEVKFVDASGDNVWWYRRANFTFSGDWQQIRIKRRQIDFAWGPTHDKVLHRFAGIEFVVAAGADGGSGKLWFDQLALKPVIRVATTKPPTVQASSQRAGYPAAQAMDGKLATAWRSQRRAGVAQTGAAQTLEIDLQQVREFGGIEIDWLRNLQAAKYTIELSLNGQDWQTVRNVTAGNGGRDSHLLPESEARWIRLTLPDEGHEIGIAEIYVRDLAFGASPNAFVQSLATQARRGCYPRAYLNEQSYWTVLGVDGDSEESLFSEDGVIEARKAGYSLEPFVKTGNALVTWADVSISHSLAENYLPIPSVKWRHPNFELKVTAVAVGKTGDAHTRMTYRLANPTDATQQLTLALVVRPFQVNPPAQFLNIAGGVSPIHDLQWRQGSVRVDGVAGVFPQSSPQAFQAAAIDADSPCEWLLTSDRVESVHDPMGLASGALLYEIDLGPGTHREVVIDLPLHATREQLAKPPVESSIESSTESSTESDEDAAAAWREKLNRVELDLPADGQAWFDTLRTALAHVMINRDGPRLQPGARSYERSWIRDGAMTSEMLLRLGHAEVAKTFLLWYADYQFANGKIPCCVDARGADPVPENDSGGEFLFLVNEVYRYTGDTALLRQLWPRVVSAVAYMDELRASERTALNQQEGRRAFYGLMPASISHEGYSAKPMHSYWDNFWALAGYESAVKIARALEHKTEMRSFIAARDQFRSDLYRSLQIAMRVHDIDYLPGAAELGDFDATSTSIAIAPVGEQQMLPPDALYATFERYWSNFQARRTDTSWDVYTPYELRNLATFVRLGWRERAQQLLQFFMQDRRPPEWNQWAEVVGRERRKSHFIGDMPHGWVASDYGRSLLDMFAYERPADESLVLMAGVPQRWTEQDGFAVKNLRTPYGLLNYSLKIDGKTKVFEIGAMTLPVGGIVISWPEKPAGVQSIRDGSARWFDKELRVWQLPFKIEFNE